MSARGDWGLIVRAWLAPKPKQTLARNLVSVAALVIATCVALIPKQHRQVASPFLLALAATLAAAIANSNHLKARLLYNTCKNESATHILLAHRDHKLSTHILRLRRLRDGEISLEYKHRLYRVDAATRTCHRLRPNINHRFDYFEAHKGLTEEEAKEASDAYGANECALPRPAFVDLLQEHALAPFFVFQLFCVLLWSLDDYWYYSVFTLAMLLVFESTVVQSRLRNIDDLRELAAPASAVNVKRNGKWTQLSSIQLVPGDLIELARTTSHYGDIVETICPADVLLLRGSVALNESALTGESTPQLKESLSALGESSDSVLDLQRHRASVLLAGTKLLQHSPGSQVSRLQPPRGGALGYVLRTGFHSSQGKLMRTIIYAGERATGNTREVLFFIMFLLVFAIVAAAYVLLEGLADPNRSRYKLFLHCIMIITSVVPPELPMELSMAVSHALLELQKASIYCTEPFRIPIAGKIDLCCFDKTGTLTSDDLVIEGVAGMPFALTDEGESAGGADAANDKCELSAMLTDAVKIPPSVSLILAACNQLMLVDGQLLGDPMERAALAATGWVTDGKRCAHHASGRRSNASILTRFAFSSELKRSSVVVHLERLGGNPVSAERTLRVLCKGAPETIRTLLRHVPKGYDEICQMYAGDGKRVLALANREIIQPSTGEGSTSVRDLKRADVESDLMFMGFLVLHCPNKPESAALLATLRASSHKLQMITGDQLLTACHAARTLGLIEKQALILREIRENHQQPGQVGEHCGGHFGESSRTSPRLEWGILRSTNEASSTQALPFEPSAASFDELANRYALCVCGKGFRILEDVGLLGAVLPSISVLARMVPEQKERALAELKKRGLVTMMCGDGTNDVGALKQADVSVALVNATYVAPPPPVAAKKAQRQEMSHRVNLNRDSRQATLDSLVESQNQPRIKLGDASIAAAFTAKTASVRACESIVLQGRCALVTTVQMCKILALNCLVSAYSLSVLHLKGVRMGETQATVAALATAAFFLFLSSSRPLKSLSPKKPPSSVLSPFVFVSVILQFLIHLAVLARANAIGESCAVGPVANASSDEITRREVGNETQLFNGNVAVTEESEFKPTVVNTIVWLISSAMLVTTFFVNFKGKPYMQPLKSNKGLRTSLLLCGLLLLLVTNEAVPGLGSFLELVPLDEQVSSEVTFLMIIDCLLCWVSESLIVRLFGYA